jgi:hypothetical protein
VEFFAIGLLFSLPSGLLLDDTLNLVCRELDFVLNDGLDLYILRRIGSPQPSPMLDADLHDWVISILHSCKCLLFSPLTISSMNFM